MSRYWHAGRLPPEMRLTDGRRVHVVYRGVWSNSDGPDFANTLIDIDGELKRGSVEVHLRSSDWYRHGHDQNGAYDAVALHVVLDDDLESPVTASDGRPIPTLVLDGYQPLSTTGPGDSSGFTALGVLGSGPCLPTLAAKQPDLIRDALRQRGWERMVEKQLRFSQALSVMPAGEVLYVGLLDALGYSRNRQGMALLGERLSLTILEALLPREGRRAVQGALLGVAGFLPLSPVHARMARISDRLADDLLRWYPTFRNRYGIDELKPDVWTLNRVRPVNHPISRLTSLTSLIASAIDDGLLATLLSLDLDGGRAWDRWLSIAEPPIGADRRRQIIANIFAPFLAAYAEVMRDESLAQDVAALWEQLPGQVSDGVARSTRQQIVGRQRFPVRLALEEQGLHQIGRNGCAELRCFECPIAALAVEHEPWLGATVPAE